MLEGSQKPKNNHRSKRAMEVQATLENMKIEINLDLFSKSDDRESS